MRTLAIAIALASAPASADVLPEDPPLPELVLRVGVAHTQVYSDVGHEAFGPRVELEATVHPIPWLAVGAVGLWARYRADGLADLPEEMPRNFIPTELWAGVRLYIQPHWRVFVGGTLWAQFEHASGWNQWNEVGTTELIAGVNIARYDEYTFQVAGTRSTYSFYGIGGADVYSLMLGVQRPFTKTTTR